MRCFFLSIGFVLCQIFPTYAQNTEVCKIITGPDSIRQVVLNGVKYDLYDETKLKKIVNLKITNDSLREVIAAKNRLLAVTDTALQKSTTTVAAQENYIASLTDMMNQYKQMYLDARKFSRSADAKVAIDAGIGVSGAEGFNPAKMSNPVLLAGISLWKFKTYVLLQEKNVGLLIGGSFRLF